MSEQKYRRMTELSGAKEPGDQGLMAYAREKSVTIHDLQREMGIGVGHNQDEALRARTQPAADRIRPLVSAVAMRASGGAFGSARAMGLERVSLADLLAERFGLDSIFPDDAPRRFNIHAGVSKQLPAYMEYDVTTSPEGPRGTCLTVMADPECGFVNLRGRWDWTLVGGEANVVDVPGMLDVLMADVQLLPPAEDSGQPGTIKP